MCTSRQARPERGKQQGLGPFFLCRGWGLRCPGWSRQKDWWKEERGGPAPQAKSSLYSSEKGAWHTRQRGGSEGQAVQELATSLVASAKLPCHLRPRPTLLPLLLWEIHLVVRGCCGIHRVVRDQTSPRLYFHAAEGPGGQSRPVPMG